MNEKKEERINLLQKGGSGVQSKRSNSKDLILLKGNVEKEKNETIENKG